MGSRDLSRSRERGRHREGGKDRDSEREHRSKGSSSSRRGRSSQRDRDDKGHSRRSSSSRHKEGKERDRDRDRDREKSEKEGRRSSSGKGDSRKESRRRSGGDRRKEEKREEKKEVKVEEKPEQPPPQPQGKGEAGGKTLKTPKTPEKAKVKEEEQPDLQETSTSEGEDTPTQSQLEEPQKPPKKEKQKAGSKKERSKATGRWGELGPMNFIKEAPQLPASKPVPTKVKSKSLKANSKGEYKLTVLPAEGGSAYSLPQHHLPDKVPEELQRFASGETEGFEWRGCAWQPREVEQLEGGCVLMFAKIDQKSKTIQLQGVKGGMHDLHPAANSTETVTDGTSTSFATKATHKKIKAHEQFRLAGTTRTDTLKQLSRPQTAKREEGYRSKKKKEAESAKAEPN